MVCFIKLLVFPESRVMIFNALKVIIKFLLGLAVVLSILYGLNWVIHNQVYSFFFEDRVKHTIAEMVDPGSLKR